MVLLKELVANDLVDPSIVAIGLRYPDHYQIQIKGDYKTQEIEEFAKHNKLIIDEDKEKKYLRIYKP